MWCGGIAGFVGWLASLNWLGLIGAAVAIVGGAVNIYVNWQRNKREKALHEAKMNALLSRKAYRKTDYPGANFRDELDE